MLKLAAIFKNGMILQRNSTVAIFGESDCDYVTAKFKEQDYKSDVIDGHFLIKVMTGEATDISCKETRGSSMKIYGIKNGTVLDEIVVKDILVGEVWLAGGQSNMELELKDSFNGEAVAKASDFSFIRFYNVPKCATMDDSLFEAEKNTAWKNVAGEDCKYMSAVAYYFATKLFENLNVPIGIIDCYWGGTSATCWVDRQALSDVDNVQGYIREWEEEINNKSDEQFAKEMDEYNSSLEAWQSRVDELKAKDPDVSWVDINLTAGPYPWPLPRGKASQFRPFGLHKTMIKRVAPYGIKGFIYYQAEEDGERAEYYSELNCAVIRQWREDFDIDGKLEAKPFYITQLPMFIANGAQDDKQWCVLRQQQELCTQINDNVGIAVISDCGEFDNIHPTDKMTPGYRLANQVLANTYNMENGLHNCKVSSVIFEERRCVLSFEKTYGGLAYKESDGRELTALKNTIMLTDGAQPSDRILGIEVSNDGKEFYSPSIEVDGDRLIVVGNNKGSISIVRYAYFNYGVANLYSLAGVPVMPFIVSKMDD